MLATVWRFICVSKHLLQEKIWFRFVCRKKLAEKKVVLVEAEEYADLKRRLAEISDTLEKISRGDAAYRQGRTKAISSLSELAR
jgi:hypothetical protein